MSGKIVSFANNKGGSGKSTTCVALVGYLSGKRQRKRKPIMVIDSDNVNFTSTSWLQELDYDGVDFEQITDAKDIVEAIKKYSKQYDYVLIDCPAQAPEATRMAMMYSDLVVMPVKATPTDLRAAITIVTIFKQMQRDGHPKGAILINQAKKNTVLLREAKELINKFEPQGIYPFQQVIYNREVIGDSHQKQSPVWSGKTQASKDALSDYRQLFKELLMILED